MKIAIDCRMINCTGIGTFLRGILPHFISILNVTWVLIGREKELIQYMSSNVELIHCDISIFSLSELFLFPTKRLNCCDAFFTPNYNIPGRIKVPIFSTIHDVLFLDCPELTNYIGKVLRKSAINRAVRISDVIFTVSNFSKGSIKLHTGTFKPIVVCYNGADDFRHVNTCRLRKPIRDDYFLYVGNIKPHKGLKILIDAYKRVENNVKLVLIGNKDNFRTGDKRIIKDIEHLVDEKKVIFTGYVDRETLLSYYKFAKCLIQPSIYEGFGLPPLEAMYLDTPAIVSDIPVFKELYFDFPVTYFRSGDEIDLAEKMSSTFKSIRLNEQQKNLYSYQNTAKIIFSILLKYLHENSPCR